LKESRNRREADDQILHSRQLLANGDYKGALEANRAVLSEFGKDSPSDEALFNMGLIYAHYGNPDKDYNRSVNYFRKVIDEYPQSPLIEQARIWSGVLRDLEKLKTDELVIVNERILRSRQMLAQGNYREALKEVQNFLSESSGSPYADRALFYAGLIYAHYGNPERDYKKSIAYFEQIIKEFPQSYLLEQAKIMVGIFNVIEKAKQVDIEIEKKKKEMTRQ
jgi:outer membrane protein assembly factor BamD (BamD/ComL family)